MKVVFSMLTAAIAAAGFTSASAADALYVDSNTVRQVQKTLNDRGFRTGGVDGRMGPQTQAALVNFQRAEKLPPTARACSTALRASSPAITSTCRPHASIRLAIAPRTSS